MSPAYAQPTLGPRKSSCISPAPGQSASGTAANGPGGSGRWGDGGVVGGMAGADDRGGHVGLAQPPYLAAGTHLVRIGIRHVGFVTSTPLGTQPAKAVEAPWCPVASPHRAATRRNGPLGSSRSCPAAAGAAGPHLPGYSPRSKAIIAFEVPKREYPSRFSGPRPRPPVLATVTTREVCHGFARRGMPVSAVAVPVIRPAEKPDRARPKKSHPTGRSQDERDHVERCAVSSRTRLADLARPNFARHTAGA